MPAANIHRAESLRSERSDASQSNKRVSFNADVDVKHIPRGAVVDRHGRLLGYLPAGDQRRLVYNVYKEPTALSETQLAREAERIIQQVDQIACTVSPSPGQLTPAATVYETRSLERRSKRNNQPDPSDPRSVKLLNSQQANWSRTLPTTSTKNKLETPPPKSNVLLEKNVLHNNQVNQQVATQLAHAHLESGRAPLDADSGVVRGLMERSAQTNRTNTASAASATAAAAAATTTDIFSPTKYDSGIEMDHRIERGPPPLTRNNVNLIVQQLTEEARQREQWRKKYEEEGLDLAPRLPVLALIEPDPTVGLAHNKNLPFSYTGGSPTRLSPLRKMSPPRQIHPDSGAAAHQRRANNEDIVYAQVVVDAKDTSPERNLYRSTNGLVDKVPSHGKLFQNKSPNQILGQHPLSSSFRSGAGHDDDDDDDDVLGADDQDDIDALKAKARFLFGDDGRDPAAERRYGAPRRHVEPVSLSLTDTTDASHDENQRYRTPSYRPMRNDLSATYGEKNRPAPAVAATDWRTHYRNEANNKTTAGLSYKYSTLLKESSSLAQQQQQQQQQPSSPPGGNLTTRILISTDNQQSARERVFHYSDDEDLDNNLVRRERSVSPEPAGPQRRRPNGHREPVGVDRIRPLRSTSPESSPEPVVKVPTSKQNLVSIKLIQEAERGRTQSRRAESIQEKPRQRQPDYLADEPPKAPIRTKKLRERADRSTSPPSRPSNQRQVAFNQNQNQQYYPTRRWNDDDDDDDVDEENGNSLERRRGSSPTRGYHSSPGYRRRSSPVRFASHYAPGDDRRRYAGRYQRSPSPEIQVDLLPHGRYVESDASAAQRPAEPEKQDKIRRQRNKFLAVFLGPKSAAKSKNRRIPPAHPEAIEAAKREMALAAQLGGAAGSSSSNNNNINNNISSLPRPQAVKGPSAAKWGVKGQPVTTKWQSVETSDGYDSSLRRSDVGTKRSGDERPGRAPAAHRELKGHRFASDDWPAPDQVPRDGRERSTKALPLRANAEGRSVVRESKAVGTRFSPPAPVPTSTRGKENMQMRRRGGSADRTDTSESDDIRAAAAADPQRFKNQRQKSQSFTNLQYRRVDGDSDQEERLVREEWNSATLDSSQVRQRRSKPQPLAAPAREESRISGDLRYQRDARPYASTNVIHETAETRTGLFDERDRHERRVPVNANYGRQPLPIPAANVRYFGDTDLESQQSGQRYRFAPASKVSRSASTAAGVGAVRRGVMHRQSGEKLPSQKQSSSVVSSESESQASNMQSGASADSQRSVYLHATTVADIPPAALLSQRQRRVQSREDLSKLSGSSLGQSQTTERPSLSRRTRHISRSYSVLAPWKPRHYREKYHISYSNQQQPPSVPNAPSVNDAGKPPRPPRRREDPPQAIDHDQSIERSAPARPSVARSSTMPKDSKLAGWFRKKKRV